VRIDPIKQCIQPILARWPALINSQAPLTDFSQYACSLGHKAHNYTELAISSPAVGETVSSTHCTYPCRDSQAEWAWMNIGMLGPQRLTNPGIVMIQTLQRVRRTDNEEIDTAVALIYAWIAVNSISAVSSSRLCRESADFLAVNKRD